MSQPNKKCSQTSAKLQAVGKVFNGEANVLLQKCSHFRETLDGPRASRPLCLSSWNRNSLDGLPTSETHTDVYIYIYTYLHIYIHIYTYCLCTFIGDVRCITGFSIFNTNYRLFVGFTTWTFLFCWVIQPE